jgi:hypothetical protein
MNHTFTLLRALVRPVVYLVGGYWLGRLLGALIIMGARHL